VNPIEKTILEFGKDHSVAFVFPSDIAASLWIQKALALTGAGTLPAERFIAWDRFKEYAVRSTVADKTPVSAVIRKLYALNLAERNARGNEPMLSAIIPAKYAKGGTIFAPWIARILPQLALWKRRQEGASGNDAGKARRRSHARTEEPELDFFGYDDGARDAASRDARGSADEARDLSLIHDDYRKFLDAHALFEPAWQRPPLPKTKFRYIIFYPELIEDFCDYEEIIRKTPEITVVSVKDADDGGSREVTAYADSRKELSAVALEIGKLIERGTKPEDIAISAPNLDDVAPYILRELRIRNIDCEYRSGASIGSLPAGRIFSLLQDCVNEDWSFASVKMLLLDRIMPWKNRQLAEDFVAFGIRNHCVTSWKENGRQIDIWEEAFRAPAKGDASDWRLQEYYRELKNHLNQIVKAKTFAGCRDAWFAFREKFLDISALREEDNDVVARAVAELNALASLDAIYHDYMPEKPFAFFVAYLGEKKYVPQKTPGGVSVFPYRVAAGTPFAHHFVIDASQKSAAVTYRQLGFLRQDRRLALGLSDADASEHFLAAYRSAGGRFSCAGHSFAGYRMPHGYFTDERAGIIPADDAYAAERRSAAGEPFPARVYRAQRESFAAWKTMDAPRAFSYLETPYGKIPPGKLNSRIRELTDSNRKKFGDDVLVTQTDLGTFAECNAKWFLSNVLGIEAPSSDAELMNERNLGLLYHGVLKELYEWIRETGPEFCAARIDDYRKKADEIASKAAANHSEFKGPLAAPIVDSLIRKITDGVTAMLEADASDLDGFVPDFLEDDIGFSENGVRYYGRIDRISRRRSDNALALIDYKSGSVPSAADCVGSDTADISDFQMQAYVYLAENSPSSPYRGQRIEHAWFGNIKERKFSPIVEDGSLKKMTAKSTAVSREEFENAMRAFHDETGRFIAAIRELDFTRPEKLPAAKCMGCDYRALCRYTFSVRP
jgi:RecB family exonuclease